MKINFITGNPQKVAIAQAALGKDFQILATDIDLPEVQSMALTEIAIYSAKKALEIVKEPLILTDSGFFIDALNGFPGPFVKWTNKTLTNHDFLAMLLNKRTQKAHTEDCLVYAVPGKKPVIFYSRVSGKVVTEAQQNQSSISQLFIPDDLGHPVSHLNFEEEARFWAQHNTNYSQLKAYLLSQK
mgnify:FL=1|jgi:XTP/dITP diphosphohydrolase